MALNQLSEKLDNVSERELGFEFDDAAIWSKLEQRLDNRKADTYWWVVAACLLVGLTLLPISLLKEATIETPIITSNTGKMIEEFPVEAEVKMANETPAQKTFPTPFKVLEKKGIAPIQVAEVSAMRLALAPINIAKQEEKHTPTFAAEDIAIIQASLEQFSIEKGRTMTIRASWQKSPEKLNVNYQTLKIKLYENDK